MLGLCLVLLDLSCQLLPPLALMAVCYCLGGQQHSTSWPRCSFTKAPVLAMGIMVRVWDWASLLARYIAWSLNGRGHAYVLISLKRFAFCGLVVLLVEGGRVFWVYVLV